MNAKETLTAILNKQTTQSDKQAYQFVAHLFKDPLEKTDFAIYLYTHSAEDAWTPKYKIVDVNNQYVKKGTYTADEIFDLIKRYHWKDEGRIVAFNMVKTKDDFNHPKRINL